MSDVIASFEGPFKEQRTIHSNWLPVRSSDVPKPHPAQVTIPVHSHCINRFLFSYKICSYCVCKFYLHLLCVCDCFQACADDSRKLSDQTLNFVKSHPLMDKAVPAFGGQPVLVQTSLE